VVESRSPPRAAGWLESRSPERYTLQLVGARDRDAVERFVARHGIKAPYAVFERLLDGRP
jgi:septal ring-binding cell division protein DamX